jgi:hypothetical protein
MPSRYSVGTIRGRLDASKAEARRFFWRVQLPISLLGGVLIVVGLCAGVGLLARGETMQTAISVALIGFCLGSFTLVFAIDTQGQTVRWLIPPLYFAITAMGGTSCYALIRLCLELERVRVYRRAGVNELCSTEGVSSDCRYTTVLAVSNAVIIVHAGLFARVLRPYRDRVRPRELLRRLVRFGGHASSGFATSFAIRAGGAAAFGSQGTGSLEWRALVAITIVAFFLGSIVVGFPNLLESVHDKLLARGEAFATASGIAALMQGRDAAEVYELARRLFRAVRAVDVTLDALQSSEANLALHALTIPAELNSVDVFVSHRCAPLGAYLPRVAPSARACALMSRPCPAHPPAPSPQLVGRSHSQV